MELFKWNSDSDTENMRQHKAICARGGFKDVGVCLGEWGGGPGGGGGGVTTQVAAVTEGDGKSHEGRRSDQI